MEGWIRRERKSIIKNTKSERSQQTFSSRSNHYGFTWHCLEYQIEKGVWHRIGMAIARRCRWTAAMARIYKIHYSVARGETILSFPSCKFRKFHRNHDPGDRKLLLLLGEKILLRRPVWETGLWMKSANEAESERQRRTGGLNHVWATEKGPRPSTKIVAPSSSSPVFEACGSAMKSPRVVARNRWLAAQREAINFWAYRIRQKRGNRRPRDSLMRILSSFPLKLTRSLFQRLITLQGRWDFVNIYRYRDLEHVFT